MPDTDNNDLEREETTVVDRRGEPAETLRIGPTETTQADANPAYYPSVAKHDASLTEAEREAGARALEDREDTNEDGEPLTAQEEVERQEDGTDGGEGGGQSRDEPPAGNASKDEWAAYAKSQGASDEDVESMGRDELREMYGA